MPARRTYAAATSVSVEKSEAEVKATLRRYGATAIGILESAGRAQIVFELGGRRIVMRMARPENMPAALQGRALQPLLSAPGTA